MIIENKASSSILPVKKEEKQYDINDLNSALTQLLLSLDPKLLRVFDYYLVKNNKGLEKDFVNNLELAYKEKNHNTDSTAAISMIFDTIRVQLELLNELQINKIERAETLAIFCSSIFSEFKKLYH